jgi:exosortase
MIPIPPSMTQSVSLKVKLLATEGAVQMSQFFGLPMVRDGSYIHFKDDFLLVGEVCGGLRSLIALLAFGAIMAYISKTRNWARAAILLMSGPVAVAANISRIFLLCVIGYFYGSEVAAGTVHDVSGILIFVVAFILMFLLEAIFRKIAPAREKSSEA